MEGQDSKKELVQIDNDACKCTSSFKLLEFTNDAWAVKHIREYILFSSLFGGLVITGVFFNDLPGNPGFGFFILLR